MRRSWLRRPAFVVTVIVVAVSAAVIVAGLVGAPRGPDHGCAHGSSLDACTYPPDLGRWLLEAAGLGALAGLGLAGFLAVFLGVDEPHRRPQRHLTSQGDR